jgi:hypothetical protein
LVSEVDASIEEVVDRSGDFTHVDLCIDSLHRSASGRPCDRIGWL